MRGAVVLAPNRQGGTRGITGGIDGQRPYRFPQPANQAHTDGANSAGGRTRLQHAAQGDCTAAIGIGTSTVAPARALMMKPPK